MVDLDEKKAALRRAGRKLHDFGLGDPKEPTPPFLREALRSAVPEVSQYPSPLGTPAFRGAVAGYLARRFGVAVDPDRQVVQERAVFSLALQELGRTVGDAAVERAIEGLKVRLDPLVGGDVADDGDHRGDPAPFQDRDLVGVRENGRTGDLRGFLGDQSGQAPDDAPVLPEDLGRKQGEGLPDRLADHLPGKAQLAEP